MLIHRILRAGIFILAFLIGLLRESIAEGGASSSSPIRQELESR